MYTVTNSICQRKSDRSEGMAIPPPFARKVQMSGTHSGGTPATSGVALHDEEGGMVGCKMGKPAFKDRSDSRVSVELVFEEKTDLSSRPVPSMEEVDVK